MRPIALLGLCLLTLLACLPAAARAANADDIVGFDDLVLDAPYDAAKAGDTPQAPIMIGGVQFDQASRGLNLAFGDVTLEGDLAVRTYKGRIQAIVITMVVPPAMDIKDIEAFAQGYRASAKTKYKDCKVLLDTFNDQAGVLALKDPDSDGLSLIWDVAKLSIVYQTSVMGDANVRENAADSKAAQPDAPPATSEKPSRVH